MSTALRNNPLTGMPPARIQRKRVRDWRMPEGAVYVGRPTKWGNPFRGGVDFCGPTIQCLWTPAEVVDKFRSWIGADELHPMFWDAELVQAHTTMKAALRTGALAGRDLVCWCPLDQPCHADVLLELANQAVDAR